MPYYPNVLKKIFEPVKIVQKKDKFNSIFNTLKKWKLI